MAWLAWLMLVVPAAHAAPCGMMGMAPAAEQVSPLAQASGSAHHAMPVMADDCGDQGSAHQDQAHHGATHACHCVATCATVLPVMTMAGFSPVALTVRHVFLHSVISPERMHAPPLRPPLIQAFELS